MLNEQPTVGSAIGEELGAGGSLVGLTVGANVVAGEGYLRTPTGEGVLLGRLLGATEGTSEDGFLTGWSVGANVVGGAELGQELGAPMEDGIQLGGLLGAT